MFFKFKFFLPTNDEWYGTYPGGAIFKGDDGDHGAKGFVEVTVGNDLNPEGDAIRIGFWGTDDFAMVKDTENRDPAHIKEDLMEALIFVHNIPKPISKDYLRIIGFETF
jgi:hypothetical protein